MALVVIDDTVFSKQELSLSDNFKRIVGQIFRLLPMREEGQDYQKPLNTLLVKLCGYSFAIPDNDDLISLIGKLRGLKSSECETDFMLFRRMVFEACNIATRLETSFRGDS